MGVTVLAGGVLGSVVMRGVGVPLGPLLPVWRRNSVTELAAKVYATGLPVVPSGSAGASLRSSAGLLTWL